jgi:hypothetical protein
MDQYSIEADVRGTQSGHIMAAGSCTEVNHHMLPHTAVLFPLHFPFFAHVCAIT